MLQKEEITVVGMVVPAEVLGAVLAAEGTLVAEGTLAEGETIGEIIRAIDDGAFRKSSVFCVDEISRHFFAWPIHEVAYQGASCIPKTYSLPGNARS